MLCRKPFKIGVAEFGCGQCLPCRINRRRLWTGRLMLEATQHRAAFFATLTYAPEHYPGQLVPKHMQDYLKRLRVAVAPRKVRFYGVGEYGDVTQRAHYHLVLYGDLQHDEIVKAWGLGHVHVGDLTVESAGYVASYTLKGMTAASDLRLDGRHPEFARMSLRPGIGASAMKTVAGSVLVPATGELRTVEGELPGQFRYGGKLLPFGRYLRSRLMKELHLGVAKRKYRYQPHRMPKYILDRYIDIFSGQSSAREHKRKYASDRAGVLYQISRSKKGVGL